MGGTEEDRRGGKEGREVIVPPGKLFTVPQYHDVCES